MILWTIILVLVILFSLYIIEDDDDTNGSIVSVLFVAMFIYYMMIKKENFNQVSEIFTKYWLKILLYFIFYLLIGLLYSFKRWRDYVCKCVTRARYTEDGFKIENHINRVTTWIVWWPILSVSHLFRFLSVELINYLIMFFKSFYNQITKSILNNEKSKINRSLTDESNHD